MSGYIGTQPTPQATQTRQTFTATSGQTTFATGGYQAGYLSVYLNGVKLVDGTDFTATNGSDVVLTTGAATGDILEVVAFSTFEVADQNFTNGLTVDNDGATVLTVDRASTDGTIIDVQKGGSSVGSIGNSGSNVYIGNNTVGFGFSSGSGMIFPINASTGAISDNAIDLGRADARYQDLFLSGGVYLGGTGSANKLDDYEEGSWTPYLAGATGITYTVQNGTYVKVGDLVTLWWRIDHTGTMGGSNIRIAGRPFYQYTHDTSMNIGTLGARSALNVGTNDNFFPAMYGTADAIYIYNPGFVALNYTSVWKAGSLTGTLTYRAN
jgi:hypothetical protein